MDCAGTAGCRRPGATFQNSVLPARAKPTITTRLVASRMHPARDGRRGCAQVASRISSLPMKPDSGGIPVIAIAATKNRPANRLAWGSGGAGNQPVDDLAALRATRSTSRNSAAPLSVRVQQIVKPGGQAALVEQAERHQQRAHRPDDRETDQPAQASRLASTPTAPSTSVTSAAGTTHGAAMSATAPASAPNTTV